MSQSLPLRINWHSPRVLHAFSLLLFLGLWQALASYLNSMALPQPMHVAQVLWQEIVSGQLPHHLSITLLRLLASFSIAMLLGCAIGIVLGRNRELDFFFDNWLVILLKIGRAHV